MRALPSEMDRNKLGSVFNVFSPGGTVEAGQKFIGCILR